MSINYKKQEEELLALSYALRIIHAGFKEVPKIDGIMYTEGIPEVVRTLIKTQIDYRQVQIRIHNISENTGLTIQNIRKLLKRKTLSELEAFKKVGDKIIIEDLKYFDKKNENEIVSLDKDFLQKIDEE
ncbi:MAG TPA: hypothetical protein PKC87_00730 [Candidatus Absconditabacterales bacterium]|nr:hypothetical protein [Candidatus Absconditabacterales bacterium]